MSNGSNNDSTAKKDTRSSGSTSQDGIEVRRVRIRACLAFTTLIGFFGMLIYLLYVLPSNESEVRGEYWLFMGQILGILGALVTNTLSYYFGSSDAKDK